MSHLNCPASSCRNCRHYQPEGRRGGHCHQLGVPVQGSWKACSLASPAFTPSWNTLKDVMIWQQENISVDEGLSASTHDSSTAKMLPG